MSRREADLATSLGEQHPQMRLIRAEKERLRQNIAQEVERIVAFLENEARIVAARVEMLRTSLESLRQVSATRAEAGVHLNELAREAAAVRQLYQSFLQRYKETSEQQDLIEPDARLISPATPPREPSTPGIKAFAGVGLGASCLLAMFLALLIESGDTGLRSDEEIRQALGLERIALMPEVEGRDLPPHPHQYLMAKPLSYYTEAVRSVFTALSLADRERRAKLVLVTSALPEEGKTSLVLSLGVFAARTGQSVLLVDLDLRSPNVLNRLGMAAQPGICDYVAGEAELDQVIRFDPDTGVEVLGSGMRTDDPTTQIVSGRLAELLRVVGNAYDLVVIDSPPVLGITDAQLLAPLVDRVLFVVRWQKTSRSLAKNAVSLLRQAKADLLGAVVTQADIKRHLLYGYGDVGDFYGKYGTYYSN